MGLALLILVPAPYWLGLVMAPWLLFQPRASSRVLGVWWLILAGLTPFYHPYARLWLPFHAVNWILMGWLVARGPEALSSLSSTIASTSMGRWRRCLLAWGTLAGFGLGAVIAVPRLDPREFADRRGLFAPSWSLYRATVAAAADLPRSVQGLRLLARPPVSYYLAGRVALYPMAGSSSLRGATNPQVWAIVDSAVLGPELGGPAKTPIRDRLEELAPGWEVVGAYPTDPGLPTLLDLDPRSTRSSWGDRSYPLWLLRPRPSKVPR